MSNRPHIIKRTELLLEIPLPRREAYLLQEELKKSVLETVETVFAQLPETEEIIRIPHVHIDLGDISQEAFKGELSEVLSKALLEAIDRPLVRNGLIGSNASLTHSSTEYIAPESRQFQLLQYFLQEGSFPWWAKDLDGEVWEENLLEQLKNPDGTTVTWVRKIASLLYYKPHALKRFFYQFSKEMPLLLLKVLSGGHHSSVSSFNLHQTQKKLNQLELTKARALYRQILGASLAFVPPAVPVLDHLSQPEKTESPESTGHIDQSDRLAAVAEAPHPNKFFNNSDVSNSKKGWSAITGPEAVSDLALPANATTLAADPGILLPKEEALYLENAGLALVLSCISPLFQDLGYLNANRQFESQALQERAVHLLQYIASGATECPENELVLNKIVCNWPAEESLKRRVQLRTEEKASADDFLQQLIDAWGALKNTTPVSLRYNFLMRNGKLTEKHNHWLLQVEQMAYDPFLMNSLPWSLSMIKFKWMPKRLQVEWIN